MVVTKSEPVRIDFGSFFRLVELADYVVPLTLRVICDLGVADYLADGPVRVERLAEITNSHAPSLQRALRALACKGIFTEVSPSLFALTPMAELLCSGHPLSLRGAYPLLPGDIEAWAEFDYSVRTGKSAFEHVHGKDYWRYMSEHPRQYELLSGAQQAQTRLELLVVLRSYNWSELTQVVDVGGGNGAFLAGILKRHRPMHGVLLDLPDVVSGASRVLDHARVSDRCEIIAGSFFDRVPEHADAYLLKRILYGWDDERALNLLHTIRRAMHRDSRLIVIEPLMDPAMNSEMAGRYDLMMLALIGGRARTEEELDGLLAACGLARTRTITTMMFPIIEARPV